MGQRIVIDMEEYKRLLKKEIELDLLNAAGVDNWTWYGEHWNLLADDYPELEEVEEMIEQSIADSIKRAKYGRKE